MILTPEQLAAKICEDGPVLCELCSDMSSIHMFCGESTYMTKSPHMIDIKPKTILYIYAASDMSKVCFELRILSPEHGLIYDLCWRGSNAYGFIVLA